MLKTSLFLTEKLLSFMKTSKIKLESLSIPNMDLSEKFQTAIIKLGKF